MTRNSIAVKSIMLEWLTSDHSHISINSLNGAWVHPREVVKLALQKSAAACIVYHNHPSGVQEPSQADELITARVKEALALIDVRLVDHFLGGFRRVTTAVQMHQSLGFLRINRKLKIQ